MVFVILSCWHFTFCYLTFCHVDIFLLALCYVNIKMTFLTLDIMLCHFVQMPFYCVDILSIGHFVMLALDVLDPASFCHYGIFMAGILLSNFELIFFHLALCCHFVEMTFYPVNISPCFHLAFCHVRIWNAAILAFEI